MPGLPIPTALTAHNNINNSGRIECMYMNENEEWKLRKAAANGKWEKRG